MRWGEGKEWQMKGCRRVSGEGGWGRGLEERERETEEEKYEGRKKRKLDYSFLIIVWYNL